MLNRAIIMGRLGRDPELRHTQTGTPVASFSLAVDRDFKDKQTGERETDWIDVVAWRSTAEFAAKYLSKGRTAVVDGRIQVRTYQDKDGNNRRTTEIVAEHVYFADSGKDSTGGGYGGASSAPGGYSGCGYATGGYSDQAPSYGYGTAPGGVQFGEIPDDDGECPF